MCSVSPYTPVECSKNIKSFESKSKNKIWCLTKELKANKSFVFTNLVLCKYVIYQEVRLIEVIWDVPTNFPVFAPFLHYSMKKSQHVHQAAENWVWTCSQGMRGDFGVCGSHVQLETIWGLRHHLYKRLQYIKTLWHMYNFFVRVHKRISLRHAFSLIFNHQVFYNENNFQLIFSLLFFSI